MKTSYLAAFLKQLCLMLLVTGVLTGLVACGAPGNEKLAGTWSFASGEFDGSSTSVSGTLKLGPSGRYEDSHWIGGILTHSKGT